MPDKKDIFYYAKLNGIPVYFQPEENEVVGRNKVCEWLLDNCVIPLSEYTGYEIKLYHKTITREELKKKGVING